MWFVRSMVPVLVCLILVWVIIEDVRRFIIRNSLVGLLVGCFVLDCVIDHHLSDLLPHLMIGLVGLAPMVGAFTLRAVGGGDAKLIAAALIWVGPEGAVLFALLLSVCTLAYAAGALMGWFPKRRSGSATVIPFGPSIAMAWMAYLGVMASL